MAHSSLFVPASWAASQGIALFCFPYAGGSPYLFMNWRGQLQPEIQIAALQAPGRGTRISESPHNTIGEVVAEIMRSLPGLEGRSFAFYGHSMGAILAFELARELRRAGQPQPCRLIVGAARPPQIGPLRPFLHALSQEGFLENVQSRYAGIPQEILNDPEVLALFLPALRADFAAYETYEYRPEEPLSCPITAFVGEEDRLASQEASEGWRMHTRQDFDLETLPGGHFFLDKSRDRLLNGIRRRLIP